MADWAKAAKAALARGPAALVSVIGSEGSVPRGAGTRMVVTGADFAGTIGGGKLEKQAIDQARAILGEPAGSWRVQDYPLGPLLGQCCGGRVRLLVEHLDPASSGWLDETGSAGTLVSELQADRIARRVTEEAMPPTPPIARGDRPEAGAVLVERLGGNPRQLLLFGAGHVGRAIARACAGLPLSLAWFDTREEWAMPGVVMLDEEDAVQCARTAGPQAAVAILTHDHAFDYRLTAAALAGEAGYIGLIGSKTKRARFLSRLAADGIDSARLTCPIGLTTVPGKTPEAIAVATVAQLLALGEPA